MRMMSGLITFSSDMPDAFMAVSSNFSPKLPKIISDASKMARGSAIGTIVRAA